METLMTAPCRSNSYRSFDGCPACRDAAIDAIAQAGLYVLGRTAPDVVEGSFGEAVELAYDLRISLLDEDGRQIASDELEAEQTVEAVVADDEDELLDEIATEGAGVDEPSEGMRLEDFQTVLDRIELAPEGQGCVRGRIAGSLFGFERRIGSFDIEVGPAAGRADTKNGRPERVRSAVEFLRGS
jgi:hypothetical protein